MNLEYRNVRGTYRAKIFQIVNESSSEAIIKSTVDGLYLDRCLVVSVTTGLNEKIVTDRPTIERTLYKHETYLIRARQRRV